MYSIFILGQYVMISGFLGSQLYRAVFILKYLIGRIRPRTLCMCMVFLHSQCLLASFISIHF